MKKIIALLLGTCAFTALFYHQDTGINFSLLAIFIWILLLVRAGKGKHTPSFRALSAALLLSALSFAWYGDAFSFFALYFSVLATGLHARFPRLKPVLYPLLVAWNYLSFVFRVFFFSYWLPKTKKGNRPGKRFIALFLIPAISGIAFTGIYAAGSDLLARILGRFYIGFDLFSLLLLTALGFFFMFNYWLLWIPREALRLNQRLEDHFCSEKAKTPARPPAFPDPDTERKSGEISLIVVNLILVFFIFIYNYEQFFSGAGSLSREVHQRVATIIISIVMAVGLLMFYFRSALNFDPQAKLLKRLAFAWMGLNAILVLSALLKNSEYIFRFGLTYRRIGVYIFLLLSLTGLVFTYLKIKHRRTNAYLANTMLRVFFGTFVICSAVNFSWLVTACNIRFHKDRDIQYLQDMPYNHRLLYKTYHRDPAWQPYFKAQAGHIRTEQERSFLSSRLYYRFMDNEHSQRH
ncbi:MAG TPA: DUF4173 domain-containing protein [Edaphocola sp.]|nr:DUF4173 domain-containing protein [Edaphocola sp.]